jgi:hypothetical protein
MLLIIWLILMNDYIVLDLETPNRYCNSMSSIGIVIVEDGYVVEEKYSLINPEAPFDDFNIAFTGIHPEDVKDAPTFPEYWDEIKDLLLDNIIIGQNIGTCITSMLSAIGVNTAAKRVAVIHVSFNVLGALIFLPLYEVGHYFINSIPFNQTISPFGIAVFHSVFNIGTENITCRNMRNLIFIRDHFSLCSFSRTGCPKHNYFHIQPSIFFLKPQ